MQKHVRILGWLQIGLGVLDLFIGLALFGLLSGLGILSGDLEAIGALSVLGSLLGGLMLIMAIPNLICGIGLLNNWGGWVIVMAVVLGVFNLMKAPIGTAVALYTFWIAWRLYNMPETR